MKYLQSDIKEWFKDLFELKIEDWVFDPFSVKIKVCAEELQDEMIALKQDDALFPKVIHRALATTITPYAIPSSLEKGSIFVRWFSNILLG